MHPMDNNPQPSPVLTQEPIGLIAGYGNLPVVFAQAARRMGIPVICTGIKEMADKELIPLVDHFQWCGVGQLGKMIRTHKKHGVSKLVMAGKFHKSNIIYRPWKILHFVPDLRTILFWYFRRRKDNKDDTLLLSVIDEFARDGLEFVSALDYCPEILVKPGILTTRKPTQNELRDIAFGWSLAREMGRLDVGQSVAVKDCSVLAVEAIEGTDKNIQRAGELCKPGGFVIVKVAKPNQDRRFDVPTVGYNTIETLHKSGGKVLAIEANQTIILDETKTIQLANQHGITIIALLDSDVSKLTT